MQQITPSKFKTTTSMTVSEDANASSRKQDHIELAFQSQVGVNQLDNRFYYEPILSGHPKLNSLAPFRFLGKTMRVPLWVSSMTGGTAMAHTINHNLARACRDFGMGMGLGSCRALLQSNEYLVDFDVRHLIGDELPLYANLGIAQVEQLVENQHYQAITDLIDKLSADGLIIHVNPFQEWLQPEGDKIEKPPLETIARVLDKLDIKVIVKEVGQGMGYYSLKALFQLPLAAVDFAANGGTNFAKLEMLRGDETRRAVYSQLANIGHSAEEMTQITNQVLADLGEKALCQEVIISGGVKTFLDGYYLIHKTNISSIYGQASGFLRHARGTYEELHNYIDTQVQGLELAYAFLRIK